MLKVKVYNEKGESVKELELNSKIFGVEVKPTLIHQVINSFLSNQRQVAAHTKRRGEVRGGGIKPWKQKGTGRARHGSSRSPLWSGGGVTFGPNSERNFSVKINRKMKQRAMLMGLSDKVKDDNLKVLDKLEISEFKTKKVVNLLKKFDLEKSVLIVNDKIDQKFIKSVTNIPKVEVMEARNLNILALAKYRIVLMSEAAIQVLENLVAVKKVAVKKIDKKTETKAATKKSLRKVKSKK